MTIRTVEFVYHANKYILKRNVFESIKKISIIVLESLGIVLICNFIPFLANASYINWMINALITCATAVGIVVIIDLLFYRKDIKDIVESVRNMFKRKKKVME